MPSALIYLADGFEELEFTAPWDILKRGGVEVVTVSLTASTSVTSARGLSVVADALLREVDPMRFDALVLPGGQPGTRNLGASAKVREQLEAGRAASKLLCAICAAPSVLAAAGLLQGLRVTCFPSVQPEVEPYCDSFTGGRVERDGQTITSKGAGTAAEFGFAILAALVDQTMADKVKAQMQF